MWYLFLQIWGWLILAFVLGWLCHHWFSKRSSSEDSQSKVALMSQTEPSPADNPDDLMQISGIGQVLSATLNRELGVYKFSQIAAWTEKDIEKVEEFLKFSGRVQRENWISQAKELAKKSD